MNNKQQTFLKTVRNNKVIGSGTCSVIDECYTDEEIIEVFNDYGAKKGLSHLFDCHGVYEDGVLNAAWEVYESTGIVHEIIKDDVSNSEQKGFSEMIKQVTLFSDFGNEIFKGEKFIHGVESSCDTYQVGYVMHNGKKVNVIGMGDYWISEP